MKQRDYSIDFIKIVATVLIVFHHYQQITGAYFDDGINFFNGTFYYGYIVELFFVISGYFMFSYISRIEDGLSFPIFYFNRFIRLFPIMAMGAVAYEVFLVIYQHTYQSSWFDNMPTFWGTIIASLGIQSGWGLPNLCVNNPTWYISVLMLCYILFYSIHIKTLTDYSTVFICFYDILGNGNQYV